MRVEEVKKQPKEYALSQFKRLDGMPGYPFEPEATVSRSEWLAKNCTPEQIKALIDEAIEWQTCPTLADLKSMRDRMFAPAKKFKVASEECEFCEGLGWETVHYTPKTGMNSGVKLDGARRCRCGGTPLDRFARFSQ